LTHEIAKGFTESFSAAWQPSIDEQYPIRKPLGQPGVNIVNLKEEFVRSMKDGFDSRSEEEEKRPAVEVWPDEDDFAKWSTYQSPQEKPVICAAPESNDMPFCGSGHH
jgi:hypothetical protein